MDNEDDRYGKPTHICEWCSRTFPTKWVGIERYDREGDDRGNVAKLVIDFMSNPAEGDRAIREECPLFRAIAHHRNRQISSLQLHIERETWQDPCAGPTPYLQGKTFSDGDGGSISYPDDASVCLADACVHPWFQDLVSPPNLNPVSDGAIIAMRTWLGGCDYISKPLSKLGSVMIEPVVPKRLIELQPDDGVVILTELETPHRYALLSYCWGGDQSTKTTRSNLASHMRGIQIKSLSQSIQDAIWVTKHLGIKYLWVDALCIVQDEPEELQQEIAKQAKIYQNGAVTILAGDAATAAEGFLHRREPKLHQFPIAIELPDGNEIHLMVAVKSYNSPGYRHGKYIDTIDTRAWIFQEVLLSPYILYFSPTQLTFFSPRSVQADGGIPLHTFPSRDYMARLDVSLDKTTTWYNLNNVWGYLVYEYTELQLSNPADKLLAISAVAEAMSQRLPNKDPATSYKAGLWERYMPKSLLWYVSIGQKKPRPSYRAPTWSWASVDGRVLVWGLDHEDELLSPRYSAKVVRCDTQLVSSNAPYGQVSGGEIHIESLVTDIANWSISAGEFHISVPEYDVKATGYCDTIEPDMSVSFEPGSGVTVSLCWIIRLPVSEEELWIEDDKRTMKWQGLHGLILRKKDGEASYARIGYLQIPVSKPLERPNYQRWQASFERRTITIV